jgi:hypothetical protein
VSIGSDLFDNNLLLESVHLSENKIVNVGPGFLMQQHNLKYLYMNNNLIEELNFTTVKASVIDLNANKLHNLQVSTFT